MKHCYRPLVLLTLLLSFFVGLDLDAFAFQSRSSRGSSSRSVQRSSPSRSTSRSTPSRSVSRPAPSRSSSSRPSPSRSTTTRSTPSRSTPSYSRPSTSTRSSSSYSRPAPTPAPTPSYDRSSSSRGSYTRPSTDSRSYSSRSYDPRGASSTRSTTPDSSSTRSGGSSINPYSRPSLTDRSATRSSSSTDLSRPVGGAGAGGVLDLGNSSSSAQPRVRFPRPYRGGTASTEPDGSAVYRSRGSSSLDSSASPRFTSDRGSLDSSDLLTRYGATTRSNPTPTSAPPRDTELLSARRRAAAVEARPISASRTGAATGRELDRSALRERWLRSDEGRATVARAGRLVREDSEAAGRVRDVSRTLARATDEALRTAIDVGSLGTAGRFTPRDRGRTPDGRRDDRRTSPGAGDGSGDGAGDRRGDGSGDGGYDDGYDDGYGDGYDDGYDEAWCYANSFCNWSFWNGCGSWWGFYGGWGYGLGWGWGSCWNWYWYGCGYAWWWPYQIRTFYDPFAVQYVSYPPTSYTTVVYRTLYEDEVLPGGFRGEELEDDSLAQRFIGEAVAGEGSSPERLNRAAEYYLVLGDRAFYEGRYGATVHYYAKAVEFAPNEGMLFLLLSDALFATGDYSYAAFALRKAFELEPGLATNVLDKRILYADPTEFDQQLERLEEFHRDHPLDEDARLVLAVNYLFSERAEKAVALLQEPGSEQLAASPAGTALLGSARALAGSDD